MPTHVLQWFVTHRITAVTISFRLLSAFNAILVSVALLLLCRAVETVCRTIALVRRRIDPGQQDLILCVP